MEGRRLAEIEKEAWRIYVQMMGEDLLQCIISFRSSMEGDDPWGKVRKKERKSVERP